SPTATGTFNLNGTLAGTGVTNIATGAILNLGGSQPNLQRTLNNAGTANYQPTSSMVFSGGTFNNQSGALFDVLVEKQLFQSGGTNAFNNAGTLRKLTGTGETLFNLPFNNTGTVNLQSGTLNFGVSGTDTGSVTGSATFNSNSITAPTINLDGTINGSADLSPTATGTFNLNGTLNGTGTTNIAAGATLNLGGSQPQLQRVLNNAGTANYSPTASMVFVGGTFNNQMGATFNVQSDTQLFQSGGTNAFNNAGTVRKATGAGEANFNLPFTNTGTVEVQTGTIRFGNSYTQTAGLTFLNGGNFASNSTMSVQGGELRGAGTISGNLSNGGTLNPGTSPG